MVIDCVQYRIANSELFRLLKNNRCTRLELRLLLFWARHPQAKLSLYTIATALDTARINLRDAIASLVRKSILEEQQNSNGLATYSLSIDQKIQECIEELAMMDLNQIKILEIQLQGGAILE